MRPGARSAGAITALALVAGCSAAPPDGTPAGPEHLGVETALLDGDLVSFRVAMRGARGPEDVERYAACAAAQYALIRGFGFARHVRTLVDERAGVWRGDAVYTVSPSLPRGTRLIDAEVTVADCAQSGIPTV